MTSNRLSFVPPVSSSSILSRIASISPSPLERGPGVMRRLRPAGNGNVDCDCRTASAALTIRIAGPALVPFRARDDEPTQFVKILAWCSVSPTRANRERPNIAPVAASDVPMIATGSTSLFLVAAAAMLPIRPRVTPWPSVGQALMDEAESSSSKCPFSLMECIASPGRISCVACIVPVQVCLIPVFLHDATSHFGGSTTATSRPHSIHLDLH